MATTTVVDGVSRQQFAGFVVLGDQRGRTIGFPTANLRSADVSSVPAPGVYAAWVALEDGSRWPAAVNIGTRPTFYNAGGEQLIECHLIGFSDDIYGQEIVVTLMGALRAEHRFPNVDALVSQLARDRDAALEALMPACA